MHFVTSQMGFEFATTNKFWFVPLRLDSEQYVILHESSAVIRVIHQQVTESLFDVSASISFAEPMVLQDIVLRAVIRTEGDSKAQIAGHQHLHASSNRYFQYPVQEARLFGRNETVAIEGKGSELCGWRQELYVRDEAPSTWIVHLRMMPQTNIYWLRWRTRYGTVLSIFGTRINNLLPLLFRRLFLRAERTGLRPNIQLQKLGSVPADTSINLSFSGKIGTKCAAFP